MPKRNHKPIKIPTCDVVFDDDDDEKRSNCLEKLWIMSNRVRDIEETNPAETIRLRIPQPDGTTKMMCFDIYEIDAYIRGNPNAPYFLTQDCILTDYQKQRIRAQAEKLYDEGYEEERLFDPDEYTIENFKGKDDDPETYATRIRYRNAENQLISSHREWNGTRYDVENFDTIHRQRQRKRDELTNGDIRGYKKQKKEIQDAIDRNREQYQELMNEIKEIRIAKIKAKEYNQHDTADTAEKLATNRAIANKKFKTIELNMLKLEGDYYDLLYERGKIEDLEANMSELEMQKFNQRVRRNDLIDEEDDGKLLRKKGSGKRYY